MSGRPTLKSDELIDKIINLVLEGKSIAGICKMEGMPDKSTVFRWMMDDDDFATKCARAKEIGAHAIAEETIAIADNAMDRTEVEKARVQVQARQWYASKLNPKKYGDKLDVTSGGDKVNNITVIKEIEVRGTDTEAQ